LLHELNKFKEKMAEDWLVGCGEMAKVIQLIDWSQTALGPIEFLPSNLRTSLILNSKFPITIACEPRRIQPDNEHYWPICASKHQGSIVQDITKYRASEFPIGDAFQSALSSRHENIT
jgi:hypothetical protein